MMNQSIKHNRIADRERGASLIEVAIAILVLSIGAIGLASLQISAKRAGFEAMQRTEASALAMDIFERMRANPGVLDDYVTVGVGEAVRAWSGVAEPTPPCATDPNDPCTAAQMATRDMWEWERALNGGTTSNDAGGLVRPTGCVSLDAVGGRLVTVEIAWEGFDVLKNAGAGAGCGTGSYDSTGGVVDGNRQLLRMTSYVGED